MVYLPYQRGEISNLPPLSFLCLPNPYLLWVLEGHIQHWGWAGTGVGTTLLVEVMCIGGGSCGGGNIIIVIRGILYALRGLSPKH